MAKVTAKAKSKQPRSKPKPKPKPQSKSKLSAKSVAALERAVEAKEWTSQLAIAMNALDDVPAAKHADAAALLLSRKRGHALLKAYLQAIVDAAEEVPTSTAVDALVAHAATTDRGRGLLREPVVRWRALASDPAQLDAAFRNLIATELGDPALLELGVDVAQRLGDDALVAERVTRLERARRLEPLVRRLADDKQRKRATAELREADAADRRHGYERILQSLRGIGDELAVEAMVALADDPAVHVRAISGAIPDFRYSSGEALVAAWKPRVIAGDAALIARLVACFTDMCEWSDDHGDFEHLIHALGPASARPEVAALAVTAAGSEREAIREAVFDDWLRTDDCLLPLPDAAIDAIVRTVVDIASRGEDPVAERALFYCPHPGARHAFRDALATAPTKRNDDLRWNLYFGLSHMKHPEIATILIDRLFVEDEEYWALREALEARIDDDAHADALATFDRRRDEPGAIHAVTAYLHAALADHPSPKRILDVGRLVATWPLPPDDKARAKDRKRLRFLFAHATAAALELRATSDARAFLALVKQLPKQGYSDYLEIDREEKTDDPLADEATAKLVAALESGVLDRAAEAARRASDDARAAGVPVVADDNRLALLASCTVDARLAEDPTTHAVWFFDSSGALHCYDGFGIVDRAMLGIERVVGALGAGSSYGALRELIAPGSQLAERALFLSERPVRYREILRLGRYLAIFDGAGTDTWDHTSVHPIGIAFSDEAAATRGFAFVTAHEPSGLVGSDPFYAASRGAILRKYYAPLPDGGWNSDDARLGILDDRIVGDTGEQMPALPVRAFASHGDAVAALQAWESTTLADRHGQISQIWVDASYRRRSDTILVDFLDGRSRDDNRDAAWHVQGLAEMWNAIVEADLVHGAFEVAVAGPADAAAIAAVGDAPVELVATWNTTAGARARGATTTWRVLSPTEVVAERAALRDALRAYCAARLKGRTRADWLARCDRITVIAVREDPTGTTPLVVYDPEDSDDHGGFTRAGDGWHAGLAWLLAIEVAHPFSATLRWFPDIHHLRLGQCASSAVQRAQLANDKRWWDAVVDGTSLVTRGGRLDSRRGDGKATVKAFATDALARAAFDRAVADKRVQGFR